MCDFDNIFNVKFNLLSETFWSAEEKCLFCLNNDHLIYGEDKTDHGIYET